MSENYKHLYEFADYFNRKLHELSDSSSLYTQELTTRVVLLELVKFIRDMEPHFRKRESSPYVIMAFKNLIKTDYLKGPVDIKQIYSTYINAPVIKGISDLLEMNPPIRRAESFVRAVVENTELGSFMFMIEQHEAAIKKIAPRLTSFPDFSDPDYTYPEISSWLRELRYKNMSNREDYQFDCYFHYIGDTVEDNAHTNTVKSLVRQLYFVHNVLRSSIDYGKWDNLKTPIRRSIHDVIVLQSKIVDVFANPYLSDDNITTILNYFDQISSIFETVEYLSTHCTIEAKNRDSYFETINASNKHRDDVVTLLKATPGAL